MLKYFKQIIHPEYMHETNQTNYFEGWYFKQVSHDLKNSITFIPGICISEDDSHCFIQINENINHQAYYFKYDKADFEYNDRPFYIKIKNNFFSFDKIKIDIDEPIKIKGEIKFTNLTKLNKNFIYPNIMGPFLYLKNECNHDVISINHDLDGYLNLDKQKFNFKKGKGYIEKDFGTSFPSKYVWLQSNHPINENNDSIFLSIAKVHFLKKHFTGLISVLAINNKIYRFASYNFAKIKQIIKHNNEYIIEIKKRVYLLNIKVIPGKTNELPAPHNGAMTGIIEESLDSVLKIKLYKKKQLIYENKFICCGTEFYKY